MPTKTNPTPPPLTDDSEVWKRTLAILAGMRQVAQQVRDEADQIEAANPNQMIKPGHGERVDLATVLGDIYASMVADIHAVARSCGLTMPEGLR